MTEKTLDQIMEEIRPKMPLMGETEDKVIKLQKSGYYKGRGPEEAHAQIKHIRQDSIRPHLRGKNLLP